MNTQRPCASGEPLAFLLTWTTYGTWLPGDDRGWRHKGQPEVQAPNPRLVDAAASRMMEPSFTLSPDHRPLVEDVIRKHCLIRRWTLHAVNARSNHVHVVVTAPRRHPRVVREQFMAWCTRRLKEVVPHRENFWTERGSDRWINRPDDLDAAILYVLEGQDRKAGIETT